jgi:hypothetical protein
MKRLLYPFLILAGLAGLARAQSQQINFAAPPPPPVPSVTAATSTPGSGTYCYWIVATFGIGNASPSQPACISNVGGAVTVNWAPTNPAANSYDVLRTTAPFLPNTPANIAVATGVTANSQVDSLGALSSYTLTSTPAAAGYIRLDNITGPSPAFVTSPPLGGGSSFNPFSATAGNSTFSATFAAAGLALNAVEPTLTNAGDNNNAPQTLVSYLSGLKAVADYNNETGLLAMDTYILTGFNSNDNGNKDSIFGSLRAFEWIAADGQMNGLGLSVQHTGRGDTLGLTVNVNCYGYVSASGDEGCENISAQMIGPSTLFVTTASSTATVSSCSTTLPGNVTKSVPGPTVFAVSSTTGCNPGDWITIGNGPIRSGDTDTDTVQIVAKGTGTLTAYLKESHLAGETVAGAAHLVLATMDPHTLGQSRIFVNHTAPAYAPGGASCSYNYGSNTVTCTGTSFSNTMVGGSINLPGCVRNPGDDNTASPWGAGAAALKHYTPIQTVNSGTSLTLAYNWAGPNATGAAIDVERCDMAGTFDVAFSTSAESIAAVVMRNNFTWSSGDSIEQTISPFANAFAHFNAVNNWSDSQVGGASFYLGINQGKMLMNAGLDLRGNHAAPGGVDMLYGISIATYSQQAQISITGHSALGTAIGFSPSAAASDPMGLHWQGGGGSGYDDFTLAPLTTGNGFEINGSTNKIIIGGSAHAYNTTAVLNFEGISNSFTRTYSFPDATVTMAGYTGGFANNDCVKALVSGGVTTFVTNGAGCSGGGGGIAIGTAIGSSTANSVLFVSGANNLAQDAGNFTYTSGNLTVKDGSGNYVELVGPTGSSTSGIQLFEAGVRGSWIYENSGGLNTSDNLAVNGVLTSTSSFAAPGLEASVTCTNISAAGSLVLCSEPATPNYIKFWERSVAYNGNLGFPAGSTVLTYKSGGSGGAFDGTTAWTVDASGNETVIGTITYNHATPPTNSVVCYKAGGVLGYATNSGGVIGTTCN